MKPPRPRVETDAWQPCKLDGMPNPLGTKLHFGCQLLDVYKSVVVHDIILGLFFDLDY
jgi:hypothetical protein